MTIRFDIGDVPYRVRIGEGTDLSVALDFSGEQPGMYDVPPARSEPLAAGDLIGDTRRGGSVNVETLHLTPHCNGTHTEGVGHLTHARMPVPADEFNRLLPCVVCSVSPVAASDTAETALDGHRPESLVITRQELEKHLRAAPQEFRGALVVRTWPNHISKRVQQYGNGGAPFFTSAAIQGLLDHGVRHLLTDLPSIDPLDDGGTLAAHRLFWGIEAGLHEITNATDAGRTVTELIYVPDEIRDGLYVLNLQLPNMATDAVPSRPVLYPLEME